MSESFFEARPKDTAKSDALPNFDHEIVGMFTTTPTYSEKAAAFIDLYDHSGAFFAPEKPDGLVDRQELGKARWSKTGEERKLGDKLDAEFDTIVSLSNDQTGFETAISRKDLESYFKLQDLSALSMGHLSKKLEDLSQADRDHAGQIFNSLVSTDYKSYRRNIMFFEGNPAATRVLSTVVEELREASKKATGRNRLTFYGGSQSIEVQGQKDSLSGSKVCLTVATDGDTEDSQYNRYYRMSNKSIFQLLSMRAAHAVLETADK